MFSNYVKIAIRSIAKNKLYAIINIMGLALGLAIYIFGGLLSTYEYTHDAFFENSDRVYTVRGIVNPKANMSIDQIEGVHSGLTPVIRAELSDVEAVARTIGREFLISVGENNYYQNLRFADPELLQIFNFDYVSGDSSAFNSSTGILITETIAKKYFPGEEAMGKTLTLDHEHDLSVVAVIRDVPANSHFNSFIFTDTSLGILIPMSAMERITEFVPDTNWNTTSSGNLTYVMLPPAFNQDWLTTQLEGIYERHYPEDQKEFLSGIFARPMIDANTAIWDMLGIPVIDVVAILGLLVLIIACVNYTNLATAQSMGRAREVGLRKTLGAGRIQLLSQFIIESMTITLFSMILALAMLELIIPLFNSATGKILALNYIDTLPWLLFTTITVGFLAGAYPAYLITKTNPIEALRDEARKGRSASWIRAAMIGVQFTISVSILACVLVVYAQNKQVEESSNIFAKDQIYTLDRLNVDQMEDRHQILRNEMLNIPYVESFTLSSQVPYEQSNSNIKASTILNDFESGFNLNQLNIDHGFVDTYNIPIIAGRNISDEIALDTHIRERGTANVLINELAVKSFGFASPKDAIGKIFYEDEGERGITTYTIVGVMANRNILGLFNQVKPFFFFMRDASYRVASIKISGNAPTSVLRDIEDVWLEVYPDYPMQGKFLDETFQQVYMIFDLATKSLAVFAMFALFLAAIGLFGLAAYMAEQKTKEIGIRKVLGASNNQIVKLLIWEFSKPVLWATPIALALAYFASSAYLEFFAERISLPYGMLIGAGIGGIILSWVTVASHAFNIARTNPINALHYE